MILSPSVSQTFLEGDAFAALSLNQVPEPISRGIVTQFILFNDRNIIRRLRLAQAVETGKNL
jgi:hypothetical protein